MDYRCVAVSPEGFVQQLAVGYLLHGYWFYVSGFIPGSKNPENVDRKLVWKYGIGRSRSARARRKSVGIANIHYIRFEHRFLLLATHGFHPFYDDEEKNVRDARRVPIRFAGYSISVKPGGYLRKVVSGMPAKPDNKMRVRVQIQRNTYEEMKAYFIDRATRRSAEQLGEELYNVPFEPYAPVRQQMLNILRLINKFRRAAGQESVCPSVLRYRRRIVKPFEPLNIGDDAI